MAVYFPVDIEIDFIRKPIAYFGLDSEIGIFFCHEGMALYREGIGMVDNPLCLVGNIFGGVVIICGDELDGGIGLFVEGGFVKIQGELGDVQWIACKHADCYDCCYDECSHPVSILLNTR